MNETFQALGCLSAYFYARKHGSPELGAKSDALAKAIAALSFNQQAQLAQDLDEGGQLHRLFTLSYPTHFDRASILAVWPGFSEMAKAAAEGRRQLELAA